jgi:hypothetical protein
MNGHQKMAKVTKVVSKRRPISPLNTFKMNKIARHQIHHSLQQLSNNILIVVLEGRPDKSETPNLVVETGVFGDRQESISNRPMEAVTVSNRSPNNVRNGDQFLSAYLQNEANNGE